MTFPRAWSQLSDNLYEICNSKAEKEEIRKQVASAKQRGEDIKIEVLKSYFNKDQYEVKIEL